jgi:hypothetical protein
MIGCSQPENQNSNGTKRLSPQSSAIVPQDCDQDWVGKLCWSNYISIRIGHAWLSDCRQFFQKLSMTQTTRFYLNERPGKSRVMSQAEPTGFDLPPCSLL